MLAFSLQATLTHAIREWNPKGGGGGGVVLLGILGRGVLLASPNPDPISDQKMSLFTPEKALLQLIFIH